MKTISLLAGTLLLCLAALASGGPSFQAKVNTVTKNGATLHSVTLTCTASTSTDVTGYFFYKGTTSGGESAVPLNSAPLATCGPEVDTAVVGLTTYYYTAQAFCPTCTPTNSISSLEVKAVVPGDPQPAAPVMNPPVVQ